MFLLHADISENGFYTIFWIFNRSVTKLEDADEIRSIDLYLYWIGRKIKVVSICNRYRYRYRIAFNFYKSCPLS